MSDTLETKYYRTPEGTRYRVRIIRDEDASSPRDADNVTVMHTFDAGYCSPEDITQKGAHDSIFPSEYQGSGEYGETRHGAYDFDLRRARKYAALDPDILAVRGLDRGHDGTLRLSDDDETAGYIAITRESWQRTWMGAADRKPAEALEEVMRQELDAYNRWASGEYVGVVVEQHLLYALDQSQGPWDGHATEPPESITVWQEIESCWGIDDQDYALKEAVSTLPEGAEEETD